MRFYTEHAELRALNVNHFSFTKSAWFQAAILPVSLCTAILILVMGGFLASTWLLAPPERISSAEVAFESPATSDAPTGLRQEVNSLQAETQALLNEVPATTEEEIGFVALKEVPSKKSTRRMLMPFQKDPFAASMSATSNNSVAKKPNLVGQKALLSHASRSTSKDSVKSETVATAAFIPNF